LTEVRPERTPIATFICAFEVAIAAWAILGRIAVYTIRSVASSPAYHSYPTPLLQTLVRDLDVLLAVAAAITLWQMRRSAFYLLATRFVLSFALFAWGLLRGTSLPLAHVGARSAIIHYVRLSIELCLLVLSAAITWYVYRVTKPRTEVISIPIAEATPPAEELRGSPDENQSTARFYLSSDEDQRKSD
jgi:hypothetical protein